LPKPLPAFGFLTALEVPNHGFFGGYLILSERGRPLEFHCSTPILPNQAQRILYGATLRSHVLGDLIGQTLVSNSKLPVQAILTDLNEVLGLAFLRHEIVARVEPIDPNSAGPDEVVAAPTLVLAKYRLSGTTTCQWEPELFAQQLQSLISHVDLAEPFERIREAIREAQRITDTSVEVIHEAAA